MTALCESSRLPGHWQRQLATATRTTADLLARLNLSTADLLAAGIRVDADANFPLLVPESFLRRMTPGDPRDPLLLQILPRMAERRSVPGFQTDAVDDAGARRTPGLLQKYHGRALMLAAGSCAVHCRYCFRRAYPYSDEPRRLNDWEPALREIAEDRSLTEIIFSGGDPLMLSDDRLAALCRRVDAIRHVERIRFHTRLPIVLPARITEEWIALLLSLRTQPVVVVHANHPAEIAGDCADGLRHLVRRGIPVLNQTVLLRDINDTVDVLENLSRRLTGIGVMPYYLHQLDRVDGTAHFDVPDVAVRDLMQSLRQRLPGYAVPRCVREIPGEPHKTLLAEARPSGGLPGETPGGSEGVC